MSTKLAYRARNNITLIILITEIIMAALAAVNKLNDHSCQCSHRIQFFNIVVDYRYWAVVFTVLAIATLIGFRAPKYHGITMSLAAGAFLIWGVLTVGDSLSNIDDDLSLVGGILAVTIGTICFYMSQIWNTIIWNDKLYPKV